MIAQISEVLFDLADAEDRIGKRENLHDETDVDFDVFRAHLNHSLKNPKT